MRLSASRSCRAAAARIADSHAPISHAATTSEDAAGGPDILSDWKIHENRKKTSDGDHHDARCF